MPTKQAVVLIGKFHPLIAGVLAAVVLQVTISTSPAQVLSGPAEPASFVGLVAEAQDLPLIPRDELPWFGTFWVVRNSSPSLIAPLPCPPLNQSYPVYAITSRQFLVDETDGPLVVRPSKTTLVTRAEAAAILQRQIDDLLNHVAFIQTAELNRELGAMEGEGLLLSLTENGSGGDPPTYTLGLGLCLYPPVVTSNSIAIAITNTPDSGWLTNSYDLFCTTNLSRLPEPRLCLTNWAWLGQSEAGQTNFVINNPGFPECYFRLGTMQDGDGDGLTDAYETLVSHGDPTNWDSDGDGLPDGWEVRHGMNPNLDESAQATGRLNYQYDGAGWLQEVSGAEGEGVTLDAEGNVEQAR